ncbi:hypothetical protein [Victivallis vadensis]|nr:hypothetical protein [Victivallis vadensis]
MQHRPVRRQPRVSSTPESTRIASAFSRTCSQCLTSIRRSGVSSG